ncbi:MAG: hypothetical protein CMQ15_14725 [Gammaproteobacteria bacterium]|jgi:hypothetical protein|nr:hypothetical protein [Gammaproteobacteria bacterium]
MGSDIQSLATDAFCRGRHADSAWGQNSPEFTPHRQAAFFPLLLKSLLQRLVLDCELLFNLESESLE